MIETQIIAYLNNSNLSADAYAEVPQSPPSKYVVMEKTSEQLRDGVSQAMISFKSISQSSLLEAMTLSAELKGIILAIAESVPEVSGVYLNSEHNATLLASKEYCYQLTINIYF